LDTPEQKKPDTGDKDTIRKRRCAVADRNIHGICVQFKKPALESSAESLNNHIESAMQKRNAFTLVELLVVISVIALLVAMMLPALSKARDQATLVKCSVQTRGIALATAAYAADFKSNLPPHFNINPPTGTLYQHSKYPGGYWWYRVGGGMMRGVYLWPNYIPESDTFYCPSTLGYSDNPASQSYHHNWAAAQIGTNSGPLAAIVSYAYPAVAYDVTKTNYTGDWSGVPGEYWTSPGGAYGAYTFWSESMLEPKLEANRSATPLNWDIGLASGGVYTMHNGESASISFVDGSAVPFRKVQYLEQTLVWAFGTGMNYPTILPTLRKFREEGVLP